MQSKIPESEFHQSIRGYFAGSLYNEMIDDLSIRLVVADLGWGMFDRIKEDFPDRFLNTGASEQAAAGICVGMALSGLKPFLYSITTFLIYRAFEWHINYLNHEKIPVRLIGSGYNDDYKHDGKSHQPDQFWGVTGLFETQLWNIDTYFPALKEYVPRDLSLMIQTNKPSFICLRR